ncbi:MAG TPA: hypothetical protein G4O08_11560, partial [Anaerolineae bacterium]|nr:hypothetical protein [Anaerolineae bacterium]
MLNTDSVETRRHALTTFLLASILTLAMLAISLIPTSAGEFSSVLANLSSIMIRGEDHFSLDNTGLNNVMLQGELCPTGDDLILTSGMSCTLEAGTHTYNTVTIQSGATLLIQSDLEQGTGVTLIADQIQVDGTISAAAAGFPSAAGPGAGLYSYDYGASGAGHGGIGGAGNGQGVGGPAYGSVDNPILLGSGGGTRYSETWCGGQGGGAVHLVVSGTFTINGQLSVDGSAGLPGNRGCGGGSGGSIWIEAGSLLGNGMIAANGGPGSGDYRRAGGGAGGRISVDADTTGYTGSLQAYGGSGNQYGGPGTIHLTQENKLVINNNGHSGGPAGLMEGSYTYAAVELTGSGHLYLLGTGSTFALTHDNVLGDGTAFLTSYGTVTAPASFQITDYTLNMKGALSGVSDLSIGTDGRLILWAATPLHNGPHIYSTVSVDPGGTLTLVPHDNGDSDYGNDSPFELHVTDLSIASGGVVSSDGRGYGSQSGPGAGKYSYDAGASGAGHGGIGGAGQGQPTGGASYGSLYQPVDLGSGGGTRYSETWCGGAGGGAIHLIASGVVTIDGALSANGGAGLAGDRGCGGGSGGSLWIEAGSLTGAGRISVDGGPGSGNSRLAGGGAGGRIAIDSDSVDPDLTISVAGGSGFQPGWDGTVYLDIVDPFLSTVTIDPGPFPTDGWSTATITVTLFNVTGLPMPEEPVQVALASGEAVYINDQPATTGQLIDIGPTDANGIAEASIRAEIAGPRTFIARSDGQPIEQQAAVEFVPGPIDPSVSTLTSSGESIPADGVTPGLLTATVMDSFGNPVPGAVVTFTADAGSLTQPAEPTDSNGVATGSITHDLAGPLTVGAIVNRAETIMEFQAAFADRVISDGAGALRYYGYASGPDPWLFLYYRNAETQEWVEVCGHGDCAQACSPDPCAFDIPFGTPVDAIRLYTDGDWNPARKDVYVDAVRMRGWLGEMPADPPAASNHWLNEVISSAGCLYAFEALDEPDGSFALGNVNGTELTNSTEVLFQGAELRVELHAASQLLPDAILSYLVDINNDGNLDAEDLTAVLQLPPQVTYQSHTAWSDPTQEGSTLTWELGSLEAQGSGSFTVTAHVPASTPTGTILTASVDVGTSTTEADLTDNHDQASTTVAEAFAFETWMSPTSASLHMGGSAAYTLWVRNLGLEADSYSLSLVGLDPGWVTLDPPALWLLPGGLSEVKLTVHPGACLPDAVLPFMVNVASGSSGGVQSVYGQITLIQEPQILLDAPGYSATAGSTSVLFRWRTDPPATGLLTITPQGQPELAQTFETELGSTHAVLVEDFVRYAAYEWNVQAESDCGSATSPTWSFTVGSGIVFDNRSPSFEIDRDYNQIVRITVRNDDSLPHTLLATIQNPHEDLIVNFVGSGSVDQIVDLDAGQSRTLDLAVHAQDAAAYE